MDDVARKPVSTIWGSLAALFFLIGGIYVLRDWFSGAELELASLLQAAGMLFLAPVAYLYPGKDSPLPRFLTLASWLAVGLILLGFVIE